MNDDDLTSLHELASSHLDGDNSPEARAHVAANAQLQAMVAAFESVRTHLADVAPAPVTARDAALAAAFAAFDEAQAEPASAAVDRYPSSAPVVSLASRRRWPARVMGIAAAVAAVGIIGVGVTQFGGSSDSSSESSADEAAKAQMDAVGDGSDVQIETAAESVPAMAPPSTIGSITSAGSVATVINTPADLAALPAPADSDVPDTGAQAEDIDHRSASSYSAAVACLSETQVYLADVFYNGVFGVAARDTVTGVTSAIADDCTVLVSVGP